MIAFESRKRAADPNKDQPLNVSLPFSLIDFHKKHFVSRHDTLYDSAQCTLRRDVMWRCNDDDCMRRRTRDREHAFTTATLSCNDSGKVVHTPVLPITEQCNFVLAKWP